LLFHFVSIPVLGGSRGDYSRGRVIVSPILAINPNHIVFVEEVGEIIEDILKTAKKDMKGGIKKHIRLRW
jgi:hypothetical protein